MKNNESLNQVSISLEEGFELTKHYVSYFSHKYYSLLNQSSVEDLVHDVYLKFLEKDFFSKYNSATTSKKYFVMVAVKRSLIDMLRKHRETLSLDATLSSDDDNSTTIGDRVQAKCNVEEDAISEELTEQLLSVLDRTTNSKVTGVSPLYGPIDFTEIEVCRHIMAGYSVKEIASMYINPNNNRPISSGSVSKVLKSVREKLTMANTYLASKC